MEKKRKIRIGIIIALVIGIAAVVVWYVMALSPPLPAGLIQANGRIEGDHYTVASKVAGKIIELSVREGDEVRKDQILLTLDDSQTSARLAQAQAAVNAAAAQLQMVSTELVITKQAVPLKIATAKSSVVHAQAVLSATTVKQSQAQLDAQRNRGLVQAHAVSIQAGEHTELALRIAQEDKLVAQSALNQASKQLAEAELGWEQIKISASRIVATQAQLKQAEAVLAEAQSAMDDLTIHAPATGVITTRIVDSGEVITAGSPLFDIVDLDRLYLKVYIAEKEIGKVRLDLSARVYTDAFADKSFPATLRYIASRAEFTPKEVQTPDERVKLVYAVKLYLDQNPEHTLTPGLPADTMIRWQEDAPWAKPRW
jgi:HlyD family secretion protein